jgi:hypothetical protein
MVLFTDFYKIEKGSLVAAFKVMIQLNTMVFLLSML